MKKVFPMPLLWITLVTAFSVTTGCKKQSVRYYEIPKEPERPTTLPAGHPPVSQNNAVADVAAESGQGASASLDLKWGKPASWTQLGQKRMRVASFGVESIESQRLDISITRFPGNVGGIFSNVNRWRSQLGLSPLSAQEVEAAAASLESNGMSFQVFDMENEVASPRRATRVAILEHNGFSWFFKMTGESDLVQSEQSNFEEFLKSIHPAEAN